MKQYSLPVHANVSSVSTAPATVACTTAPTEPSTIMKKEEPQTADQKNVQKQQPKKTKKGKRTKIKR